MIRKTRCVAVFVAGAAIACVCAGGSADEWVNPKAKPPRAKPTRVSAAESLPPLPLPATPLRRSEKKRQPSVPGLIGMLTFSGRRYEIVDGRRVARELFPTTVIDIERLVKHANSRLNIQYRYTRMNFSTFSWNPAELPLLYVTGWKPMPALSDEVLDKLRRYVYDGGTLVVHAQCGRKEFRHSAREQLTRLFPHRRLAPVDPDSELFHSYYDIQAMRVRKDDQPFRRVPTSQTLLEAIHVGCRPAIIFSPVDLNCGWDVVNSPIQGGILYHQDDALKLGINIITAVLANFEYAKAFATEKIYHQQFDKTRDQLVVAQIVHDGDWDPTPHALPSLMKYIQANTELNVQFKREKVQLASPEIFKHPVLYITGLRDFKFSDAEVRNLRGYLQAGGLLLADAAAGRKAFDVAFRREVARVLGDGKLKPIGLDHPLYTIPFKITSVEVTPMAKATYPKLSTPALEGAVLDGRLSVIYSPLSLANGWERLPFAYNNGYAALDAIRLGVNMLAYGMLH